MAALGVLGRLKRPSSLAVLAQAVYDPDPSVRAFAAGALGEFGSPGRGRSADTCPRRRNGHGSRRRSRQLGPTGHPRKPALATGPHRDADYARPRERRRRALIRLGDTLGRSLLAADLARHSDPSIRGAAAQALSATSEKQAHGVLQTLLQDQQPLPRLMAAKVIRKKRRRQCPVW